MDLEIPKLIKISSSKNEEEYLEKDLSDGEQDEEKDGNIQQ